LAEKEPHEYLLGPIGREQEVIMRSSKIKNFVAIIEGMMN
jgi:hypothetical protein